MNKFKKYVLILYLIFAVIVLSRAFAHKKEQIAYKDSQGSISYTNPKILKKKCKNGDYNACAHHTELLGWLGKINIDEAYKRYQKYCDLGGGYGCMMIYSSIQGNSDGSYSKKSLTYLKKLVKVTTRMVVCVLAIIIFMMQVRQKKTLTEQ